MKVDLGSSDMAERPKGEEEEEEDATLAFLACLDAAVFFAAATPDETRERAVFSFSFAWVEGNDFLTMPPDRTVPLRDLWAVAVVGLDEEGGEETDEEDEMGGMVMVGFRDDGGSSSSESSSSPWSVTAEGVSTS
jgi:hypothetical protein